MQISMQTWQYCRQITSHFPLNTTTLLIESSIRAYPIHSLHFPVRGAYTSRKVGDLSANHSDGTVEICTQKYGVYESSSFGSVRDSRYNLVVVWSRSYRELRASPGACADCAGRHAVQPVLARAGVFASP